MPAVLKQIPYAVQRLHVAISFVLTGKCEREPWMHLAYADADLVTVHPSVSAAYYAILIVLALFMGGFGMSFSLHHTAITTTRYSELLQFYTDLLGGELVREAQWDKGQHELDARTGLQDSAGRVALLRFGSGFFEIFEFSHPKQPPSEPPILADTGLTHFALSCEDCMAEYHRLLDAGMTFNAPPWRTPAGGIFTFGRDPDGNIIEILQPAPDSTG